jgi:hypothetical protein
MKLIKKDAIRFTDKNDISCEELVEDLISASICFNGKYIIQFLHGSEAQKYYVNKKTYAKCVQILKERIKRRIKNEKLVNAGVTENGK